MRSVLTRPLAPLAAAAFLAASVAIVATPTPSPAAVPTCDGKPATIVSDGQSRVDGTDGDDVMVVSGSGVDVYAGPGADTICYLGGDPEDGPSGTTRVDTGDREEADAGQTPSHDVVIDSASDEGRVIGHDVWSGAPGELNDDDLTVDDATLILAGRFTGDLVGGPKALLMLTNGQAPTAWTIDLVAGTIQTDDASGTLSGFRDFRIDADSISDLIFTGTDDAERLLLADSGADLPAGQHVQIAMGAGRDIVGVQAGMPGSVTEGLGIDYLSVQGRRTFTSDVAPRVDVSVPDGVVSTGPGTPTLTIGGINRYSVEASEVNILGGDLDEQFSAVACRAEVSGGPGDDHLFLIRLGVEFVCPETKLEARGGVGDDTVFNGTRSRNGYIATDDLFTGGPGDDHLHGGRGDDTLIGGDGDDVAIGGPKKHDTDTCQAERTVNCER